MKWVQIKQALCILHKELTYQICSTETYWKTIIRASRFFFKAEKTTTFSNPYNYRIIILMFILAQTYDNEFDIMKYGIFINLE